MTKCLFSQLEGFRARGVEVLLLPDPVDSFWVTAGVDYEGKPFKSVTQGAADLALIPLVEPKGESDAQTSEAVTRFIAGVKATLGDQVSDVRASDRLTTALCAWLRPRAGWIVSWSASWREPGNWVRPRSRSWSSTRIMI